MFHVKQPLSIILETKRLILKTFRKCRKSRKNPKNHCVKREPSIVYAVDKRRQRRVMRSRRRRLMQGAWGRRGDIEASQE